MDNKKVDAREIVIHQLELLSESSDRHKGNCDALSRLTEAMSCLITHCHFNYYNVSEDKNRPKDVFHFDGLSFFEGSIIGGLLTGILCAIFIPR